MLRIAITAICAAVVCFSISPWAAHSSAMRVFPLRPGDSAYINSDGLACNVLASNQVACGGPVHSGAISVYFFPHKISVVKFGAGLKIRTLYSVGR